MSEDKESSFFKKMVDDLIEFAEYDQELKEGIQWLDGKAREKNISFYAMVFEVLYNHDVNQKAKKWLEESK